MACPYEHYCLPLMFGIVAILGIVLLRLFGGKGRRLYDYVFATFHLMLLSYHMSMELLILLEKSGYNVKKKAKQMGGVAECFVNACVNQIRQGSEADTRLGLEEFKPVVLTLTYLAVVGSSLFCFLAFIGYLRGSKMAYAAQLVNATLQFSIMYFSFMTEYFEGFKHVKNPNFIAMLTAPVAAMTFFAFSSSFCKLCCESGTVCPAAHRQTEEKKKQ